MPCSFRALSFFKRSVLSLLAASAAAAAFLACAARALGDSLLPDILISYPRETTFIHQVTILVLSRPGTASIVANSANLLPKLASSASLGSVIIRPCQIYTRVPE